MLIACALIDCVLAALRICLVLPLAFHQRRMTSSWIFRLNRLRDTVCTGAFLIQCHSVLVSHPFPWSYPYFVLRHMHVLSRAIVLFRSLCTVATKRVLKGKCHDTPDGKPQVRGAPGCQIRFPNHTKVGDSGIRVLTSLSFSVLVPSRERYRSNSPVVDPSIGQSIYWLVLC